LIGVQSIFSEQTCNITKANKQRKVIILR